eukprot:4917149-Pyramimonas_sp.AAC.1
MYIVEAREAANAPMLRRLDGPGHLSRRAMQGRVHHSTYLRGFSDVEVLIAAGRAKIENLIRKKRLMSFGSLIVRAPVAP